MDIESLVKEAATQELAGFDLADAVALGQHIADLSRKASAPVVVNIRTPDRVLYHAALPGSAPLNDNWARRKGNVALMFGSASMLVSLRMAAKGQTLARDGLPDADYALAGGAIPIRVKGAGIVAVAAVSGLPQQEDHALVATGIAWLKGR